MDDFLITNFFNILLSIVSYFVTQTLRDINNTIDELRQKYEEVISRKDNTRQELMKEVQELKDFIKTDLVTKQEFKEFQKEQHRLMQEIRNDHH